MTDFIIDKDSNLPVYSPTCTTCRHWSRKDRTCAAFPTGIPVEIWIGENNHREPVDGDHGIRYEARVAQPI